MQCLANIYVNKYVMCVSCVATHSLKEAAGLQNISWSTEKCSTVAVLALLQQTLLPSVVFR